MNLDEIDPVMKTYKGLPLEDAEIKEIGELIIAEYKGLVGDIDGKSGCPKQK